MSVRIPLSKIGENDASNLTPPPTTRGVAEGARPKGTITTAANKARGTHIKATADNKTADKNTANDDNVGGVVATHPRSASASAVSVSGSAGQRVTGQSQRVHHQRTMSCRAAAPCAAPRVDSGSGVSAIALAALSSPSAAALLGEGGMGQWGGRWTHTHMRTSTDAVP